jgi:hypothetical protein
VVAIGVSNENLPVIVTCHQFYDLFHSVGIKLIEYIVEQQ